MVIGVEISFQKSLVGERKRKMPKLEKNTSPPSKKGRGRVKKLEWVARGAFVTDFDRDTRCFMELQM